MPPNPCRNPDCRNTLGDLTARRLDGFCFTCSSELAHREKELENDLAKVLRLAAEFAAWCLAHGQPDPYHE